MCAHGGHILTERGTMAKAKKSLQDQVKEILDMAEAKGLMNNFFFKTTLQRYTVQMRIMNDLEKEINDIGATVKKEYVKGRTNVYTNPAITEYNKTATAANGTVSTLINIVKSFSDEETGANKLQSLIGMLNNDEE